MRGGDGLGVWGTDPPVERGVLGQEKPEDCGHDDRECPQQEGHDVAPWEHGKHGHVEHAEERDRSGGELREELSFLDISGAEDLSQ